jgi:peptidoglycan/LPS O-acetylase OafA/YrhL
MKLEYYKNLDGVRAIASLMVMFFHFFQNVETNYFITRLMNFGQTGVSLFFVLSGFLITRILLYTKENKNFFKNFYFRRSLRIFPLYYFYLLIFYFGFNFFFNKDSPSFLEGFHYFVYLQNFATTFNWNEVGPSHFWSLAVEEHFYLFWPFIIFFVNRKKLLYIIIFIIVFALILRFIMVSQRLSVFYFTFTRFDSLAIGGLLAILELKTFFQKNNGFKFLFVAICSFSILILIYYFFKGEENVIFQMFKYLGLSLFYFGIIGYLLCLEKNHYLNRFLNFSFFSYTGKISYGLYVYNPLVFLLSERYLGIDNVIYNMLVSFMLVYLVSSISFYFFESKFLLLKKYFQN